MSNPLRIFGTALLVTTVCLFLTSCQRHLTDTPAPDAKEQYSGEGFTLLYPRTVNVVKDSRGHDFDIYRFIYQGCLVLNAYVGNNPDFPSDSQAITSKSQGVTNGLRYTRIQIPRGGGPGGVHVLLEFPPDRFWPTYMHCWYAEFPPQLREMAEGIVNSVKPQQAGTEPADASTRELLQQAVQDMKESVKAARAAGKPVDPNFLSAIERMEQVLKNRGQNPPESGAPAQP
jgi:hypothetical protein